MTKLDKVSFRWLYGAATADHSGEVGPFPPTQDKFPTPGQVLLKSPLTSTGQKRRIYLGCRAVGDVWHKIALRFELLKLSQVTFTAQFGSILYSAATALELPPFDMNLLTVGPAFVPFIDEGQYEATPGFSFPPNTLLVRSGGLRGDPLNGVAPNRNSVYTIAIPPWETVVEGDSFRVIVEDWKSASDHDAFVFAGVYTEA
jgi:hypothetical protein